MRMTFRLMVFKLIIPLFLWLAPFSSGLKPRETGADQQFKTRFFLPDEGQSCPDIRDSRGSFKLVKFCSVKAPDPEVPTTISFWGWDQGRSTAIFEGIVEVYAATENTEEHELFKFTIDSSGNYVQWYHREFVLHHSNITHLNLYYHIVEGNGRQFNIRDLWIRPTDDKSRNRPQRKCSTVYHPVGVCMSVLSGIALVLFSYAEDRAMFLNLFSARFWKVGRCFCPFLLVSSAMLTSYLDGYPYLRCKDDDFLIAVICIFFGGIVISFGYGVYLSYYPPEISTFRIHPITNATTEEDIIEAATSNSKKRIEQARHLASSSPTSVPVATTTTPPITRNLQSRKIYIDTDDNECTVCMECYEPPIHPAIVLKCGHVYCSKCLSKMSICATCRVEVKLGDLTLLVEASDGVPEDVPEEGGVELVTNMPRGIARSTSTVSSADSSASSSGMTSLSEVITVSSGGVSGGGVVDSNNVARGLTHLNTSPHKTVLAPISGAEEISGNGDSIC